MNPESCGCYIRFFSIVWLNKIKPSSSPWIVYLRWQPRSQVLSRTRRGVNLAFRIFLWFLGWFCNLIFSNQVNRQRLNLRKKMKKVVAPVKMTKKCLIVEKLQNLGAKHPRRTNQSQEMIWLCMKSSFQSCLNFRWVLIRRKNIGNWPNTWAKRLLKTLANRSVPDNEGTRRQPPPGEVGGAILWSRFH